MARKKKPQDDAPGASADEGFPIVGVGASAGGLAAFEAFLSGMPKEGEPGMAFVLVQHLAPDHKSILSELVRRFTRMQVFEVEDGMAVKVNCAYIIPPNKDMALLNGALRLLEPAAPRGQRLPIDFFFRSLASDQRERAIGVVLSGTGSDGTSGVRAIKGEGGLVMAQNPESVEYDGMPRSAIATGLVDFVLPAAEMASHLVSYARRTRVRPKGAAEPDEGGVLGQVFVLLRAQTGHDFSRYKPSTVRRRIERRMAVQEVDKLEDYVRFMRANPAEVEALFRDLLIGVTCFFRDPEEFKALEVLGVPALIAGKPPGSVVRVWVPGCSTGEEAYSIAILLHEHRETLKQDFGIQVFATDIDPRAVGTARAGVYPPNIASDLTPERLKRYFQENGTGAGLRVVKSLRDMMVFSPQDVNKDPPFSKVDLISCRNLLIYLGGDLQKRLIPLFHYALNPKGLLFLGNSESVGGHDDLFAPADRKARLFRRKDAVHARHPVLGRTMPVLPSIGREPAGKAPGDGRLRLRELTERFLLARTCSMAALVDADGLVLYLHGRSGRYLEPAPGEPRGDILKMAREGLRTGLAAALRAAVSKGKAVHRRGLKVKTNGDYTAADLTVAPVAEPGAAPLFLIAVEESAAPQSPPGRRAAPTRAAKPAAAARIAELEAELREKDEHLRSSTEELETANEELQSSSEEMQSVNEELQSTNEELETAKEELQSLNEELSTVNAELQSKVADLSQANNDMSNLLSSTGIATLFVDHQLRIQRFTPAATKVINLIPSDVGRPIGHIVSNLEGYDGLVADLGEVLDTLRPKEREVRSKAGGWYLLRIRPYRTAENIIEGAVVTFTDITALNTAQTALMAAESLRRLAALVEDAADALVIHDIDGKVLAFNKAAQKLYGWTGAEALGMDARLLVPEDLRPEMLQQRIKLARSTGLAPERIRRLSKDGRTFEVMYMATALLDTDGEVYAVLTTERAVP